MKSRIALVACAGAASLVGGLALSAYPAQAAPLANQTNAMGAGYAITTAVPASASAADTFTVPKITGCTATSPASEAAELAFIAVQPASGMPSASAGFIVMGCNTSASTPGVTYTGGAYVNGVASTTVLTPKAGDVMTATVSVSGTATKATLKDVTQAKSVSKTGAGGTPLEVLDGITNVPSMAGTPLPIPKFAPVTFSAAKLDGKTPKAAGAVALNLVKGKTVQILTGPLNATGNGWTETFKHA